MSNTAAAYAQAMAQAQAGNYVAGQVLLEQLLAADPAYAPAWQMLAAIHLQCARPVDALPAAVEAVRLEPLDAGHAYALGRVHKACGNPLTAVAWYRAALQRQAGDARILVSLGVALRSLGCDAEAITCYQQALQVDPASREARANLSAAQAALSAHREPQGGLDAAALLRQATAAEAQRLFDLGESLLQSRKPHAARALLWEARQLAPDSALIEYRYGCTLNDLGQDAAALEHFERATQLQPTLYEAANEAARTAAAFGLVAQARRHNEVALALRPSDALHVRLALSCAAIHESVAAIAATRQSYERALGELLASPPELPDPLAVGENKTFYLAYHGLCNRDLHTRLSRMFTRACPSLAWQAPHCRAPGPAGRRIRVGFISRFMHDHSIGKTTRGLVAELPRQRFETFTLNLPPVPDDATTRWLRARSEHWLALPSTLGKLREQIAALQLDILFYQDVGMDALAYFLAHARLAPGAVPVVRAPRHHGHRRHGLLRLQRPVRACGRRAALQRDAVPAARPANAGLLLPAAAGRPGRAVARRVRVAGRRARLRLPADAVQAASRFDAILAQILRSDARGRVALISGNHPGWDAQLRERFERVMPDVAVRIAFLPRMGAAAFRRLLAVSDVVLDTPHFNGMNSSLESFAVGTPVVTLPAALQRGRHTQAMYRAMQIDEPVAADAAGYARPSPHASPPSPTAVKRCAGRSSRAAARCSRTGE